MSVPPDLIRAIELRARDMALGEDKPPADAEEEQITFEEEAGTGNGYDAPEVDMDLSAAKTDSKKALASIPEKKGDEPDYVAPTKTEEPAPVVAVPKPVKAAAAARFFVGVDWSHTSPAVAIVTPMGRLHVAALHRNAACKGRVESSVDLERKDGTFAGRTCLTLFPQPDWEKMELAKIDPRRRPIRLRFNIQTFVNFIVDTLKQSVFELDQEHPTKQFSHMRLEMGIEDYAFGKAKEAQSAATALMLAEDAGSFKLAVFQAFGVALQPVNISHVKKTWTGQGNATKELMCKMWRTRGLPAFNLPCCIHEANHLQSPYNDMVDATAVCNAMMMEAGQEFIATLPHKTPAEFAEWRGKMIDVGDEFRRVVKNEDA